MQRIKIPGRNDSLARASMVTLWGLANNWDSLSDLFKGGTEQCQLASPLLGNALLDSPALFVAREPL